ncbi:hypothetical protein [Bythopirellula polymerisocia]|uniref:Uncharacterized protein n=1 Tax=Bythopirellula polymerisocia TaxID=2528003 RepID=A0A5C6CD66_9BACT|nr:hypothetical protein [Bythopirellula polymerisocia]TWU21414.1 hypothetical protein Pla144_46350 [Bythopirellula polymerisocia]
MEYQYEVTSLVGYLQRVATHLLPKGYYFFVQGLVPADKNPPVLDAKLLAKYDVAKTEGARRWRKSQGLGNVQYVRFQRAWILLATHGDHPIREGERTNLKDVRRMPIRIGDYSITVKRGNYLKKRSPEDPPRVDGKWRVRVLIARDAYRELSAYFLSIACHRRAEALAEELYILPYVPYAPVRKQLLKLLRLINAKRQAAGYAKIPPSCLRFKREIVRSFEKRIDRNEMVGEASIGQF